MMSWDKFFDMIIYWCMPIVSAYHLVCSNAFLNISAVDATGIEKVANFALAPTQYLLAGKVATIKNGNYILEQRFDYYQYLPEKTALAILSLPISLPLGLALKGAAFLSKETRIRHAMIVAAQNSKMVEPMIDYYSSLGIPVETSIASLSPPEYTRRPGDEEKLKVEKDLLKVIVQLFKEAQIPFWVDCGTCLGTYRYGGSIPWDTDIDIAILLPDFQNVMHVLNALDKDKYAVQDWSNRCRPKSYIRVYIRENRNHIDIYHFSIDPIKRTLSYLLSNEISSFMIESWKVRERQFTIPSDYETIFPLKRANFDGIEVYVPNKTKEYLQERYGKELRPTKVYNIKSNEYEKDPTHPYWENSHAH